MTRWWMVLGAAAALAGCTTVAPYQREALAEPAMQVNRDPVDQGYEDHIYFSIEGSSGGRGFGGGGCGCN